MAKKAEDDLSVDLEQLAQLAKLAGDNISQLTHLTKSYGSVAAVKNQVVSLKQARDLLKAAGNNTEVVRAALKGAGVSAKDLSILMGRLHADVDKARRKALEFESVWSRMFSPRTVWYASHAMNVIQKGYQGMQATIGGPINMARNLIDSGIATGRGVIDQVIEAQSFRQNALTGMSYMLNGDMGQARQLFADAQKLAQKTPLDTNRVIQGIKTFLTQGFSAEESKYLYKVVADQSAKFLDQPEVEQSVIGAFSRMKGRGYATAEDLESLRVAKFKNSDVIKQLSQQKGISELMTGKMKLTGKESEEEAGKKIRELISTGKVGTYTLMNAAIASLYQGKDLDSAGKLAEDFGGSSLTGAISNATNAFSDLLSSMDLVNGKGFKAFMGFMSRYSDMLGNATGPGKKLRDTIESFVDEVLVGFNLLDEHKIESIIDVIGMLGKSVVSFFKEAWGWLDKLVNAEPGEFIDNVKDVLIDVGTYIGEGITKGVKNAALGAVGAAADTGSIKKYGATSDTIEKLALAHGANKSIVDGSADRQDLKVFRAKYLVAEKAFREEGMVGTVFKNKGESAGEAYSRRVAEYAAATGRGLGIEHNKAGEAVMNLPSSGAPVTTKIELPSSTPSFAAGGTVGGEGPIGSPQFVVAHKGEHFNGVNGKNVGGSTFNIGITVMGDVKDPDALAAALRPMIAAEFRTIIERLAAEGGG